MTMRRAAPGPQLAVGHLRVDAARAIAKLREYQLADRAAWVLEGIRAAVASAATRISLRGDANDIWLAWDGPVWDSALLPQLFDELVSPQPAAELQHVRLLAAAVNSALGMNPAFVDVYAIASTGSAQCVRYTPDVLAEPEDDLGEAPLRHVAVQAVEPPPPYASGMLVHLRRRASLEVLGYLFGEPPELPIARANCQDIPVALEVGDQVLQRTHGHDVVRVPLGDGLDGFVAVTDTPRPRTLLEVAERGVVLARYPIDLLGLDGAALPLRVFIDADRLPTNASRSQVRQDVHPIATAERRVKQVTTRVIGELVTLVNADAAGARTAALQLLAADVPGPPTTWQQVSPMFAPLAALPLLRNAIGQPRPVNMVWRREIYTGRKPLDADLMPWLGEVVWLPSDDPARQLLGNRPLDKDAIRGLMRSARQQRRAHRKFLAHAKRDLRVQTAMPPRIRAKLGVDIQGSCVPDDVFADTRGEICVYGSGRDAALVVMLDGRELERIEVESELAFDAVIECDQVRAADRYRGVVRDSAFATVYRAMRAGVVRAVEGLVTKSDDCELAADASLAADMRLVRQAIALVAELHVKLEGPLADAPAWVDITGKRVSFAGLRRGNAVGVVASGVSLVPPRDRPVLVATDEDIRDLRKLFGHRVVSYAPAAGTVVRITSARLAAGLPRFARAACLHVRDGDIVGAIALASVSSLALHHMGVRVSEHAYTHIYLPCAIAIDSDTIVPTDDWTGVFDHAGLCKRSYTDWELALVRAVVSTILGDRPAELDGPERIQLDDDNGTLVCKVLMTRVPRDVLGDQLLARLVAAPMFTLLGMRELYSITDIAARFPSGISYVDWDAQQIDDFVPVVASERIAQLIARLAGRECFDGRPELERRQRQALFRARYDAHLARPESPLELPDVAITAPIDGGIATGIVGLTTGVFEIRVRVAGRPFTVVHPPDAFPLVAVVDVEAERCDDTFGGLRAETLDAIAQQIGAAVPGLLRAIATQDPAQLGTPSPARTLLAAWLPHGQLDDDTRELLRAAPAFMSIQGERVSLAVAAKPRLFLSVATWADTWLGPTDGESPTTLDSPVISVSGPHDELHAIVETIHAHTVGDVTSDVVRLQARRRMARGLLPTPKLGGVAPAHKRELRTFGARASKLGHGEIGLATGSQSTVLVHEHGVRKTTVEIDVIPTIELAVEDPHEHYNIHALRDLVQQLTIDLVRGVVAATPQLPLELRRNLARGVLANRIPPSLVANVPLFMLTDASWVTWSAFTAQLERFGNVWALTAPMPYAQPLDDDRIVILLDGANIELAVANGYRLINAKLELELDARARGNRAKQPARSLALPSQEGVLATIELDGDGRSRPSGIVAVLVPAAAYRRGVHTHREMKPLGVVPDVCKWPTIAVIDDARIVPDRTWSAPKPDETWQAIAKEIRTASEEALATLGTVPEDALSSLRITNHACADVAALRDAPHSMMRGALWLTAVPYAPATVMVRHIGGLRSFVPAQGLAIGGWLAVYGPDRLDVDAALEQLCGTSHAKLVRALQKSDHDRDVVAAHVAHAIALKTIRPTEVFGIEFDCFSPRPLSARALASLLRSSQPVPLDRATDDAPVAFVDDDSELAKVVRLHLGDRLFKPTRRQLARTAAATPDPVRPVLATPPVSTRRPAPAPARKVKVHPLRPLVDALAARVRELGMPTFEWVIDEYAETMIAFSHLQIVAGGRSDVLRRIADQLDAGSARAASAIDAVAAHVVSVLNVELSDVTDATEIHALGVLLASPRSAGRRRSRQSS